MNRKIVGGEAGRRALTYAVHAAVEAGAGMVEGPVEQISAGRALSAVHWRLGVTDEGILSGRHSIWPHFYY